MNVSAESQDSYPIEPQNLPCKSFWDCWKHCPGIPLCIKKRCYCAPASEENAPLAPSEINKRFVSNDVEGSGKLCSSRRSANRQQTTFNQLPALCVIVQEITDLAFTEKEICSPILEKRHPIAVGMAVAVATLHSGYAQQVLIAADKLEMFSSDGGRSSFNSDDGGKSIIQEMTLFEVESFAYSFFITLLKMKSLAVFMVWNPMVNKGQFTPSAEDVLRTISDTLEALFYYRYQCM
ncbi:hypothetical protein CTI12_AA012120 [Artemisia annua]|uniref:Uncharacterized protein n=1 Tax=Artemisia annua TaxID=35608 RepID=A0A2U1QMF2_ARTAN|nr:hypothetical protein CTI12_AA012120 [Artemisia annua]